MIKLRRSTTILWLFFGVLVLAAPSWAQTRPPEVEELAKTYGLDSYGQIEALRYTFNLDLPALKVNLSRTWTWEPKTGQVTYETKDKDGKPVKVTYNRSQLNSGPANVKDEIEPAFVNDNY
jgi:polyisoprenoid-binding protein YceI